MNIIRQSAIKYLRIILAHLEDQEKLDTENETHALKLGDVYVDFNSHQLSRDGESISLTPSEYKILLTLASYNGNTIDYAALVKLALDYDVDSEEAKELIKRHIFTLRQKIGPEFASPKYILNVRGYGYRLVSNQSEKFLNPA